MRISTRLGLAIMVPALMAMIIGAVLLVSYRITEQARQHGRTAKEAIDSLNEMTSLINSYVLYHQERAVQQFTAEHDELMGLTGSTVLTNREQQSLLDGIRTDSVVIREAFLNLAATRARIESGETAPLLQEIQARLQGQLLTRSRLALSDAVRLERLLDAEIAGAQQATNMVIIVTIAAAGIALTFLLVRMRRSITSALLALRQGAQVVGAGKLEHRIGLDAKDEVGDLARSLDDMAAQLQVLTVSRLALQEEVEERKRAEDALAAERNAAENERQRLEIMLRTVPSAVVIIEQPDGRVSFINQRARQLYGMDPLGLTLDQHPRIGSLRLDGTPYAGGDLPASRSLLHGQEVHNEDMILQRPDGSRIYITASSAPLRGKDGRITAAIGVFDDITERKKTEQLKDEFIGMVSHEIKTPLTVIMGALATASMKGLTIEQVRGLLQDAVSYSDVLADIVDNLLELSRSQANRLVLQRDAQDLAEIARRVLYVLQPRSAAHRLVLEAPPLLPRVMADRTRLERILHNLVDNAIKYSPGGGVVKVTIASEPDQLVVTVSDQGIGIRPEDQPLLFRSFERLETNLPGSLQGVGLGLVVCRLLVEAHGGRLSLRSEWGKGAAFSFTVPLTDGAA